jgi:alkylhydroperoxidase/carboxymuconolactone decarboxylase family protein YurZ
MDVKTKELTGIAAAVAGHCRKYFSYYYNQVKRLGIEQKDIQETVEFAQVMRSAGNQGADEFVKRMLKREK